MIAMKRTLQSLLLASYRVFAASGMLRTTVGRRAYEWCYDLYKAQFEAKAIDRLREYVPPDTMVVDVGANIGFFTLRFAGWLTEGGRVLAVEPDHDNLVRLQNAVARAGLEARVDLVEGAATEACGNFHLVLNPNHPADHRLGDQGIPIAGYSLDALLADRGWPTVSLIKIDVQGAEVRVLRGARETIRRFRPALYVEIDDGALTAAGV
jgi:FkbM family methyltransferase